MTPARLRILPEAVVNQIAAGEVVERPASVVKELMENALDAGAARIALRLKGAGGQFISVTDDGCGLSPDDALLALERHSTSKISSAADMETVATMGFRGEALPSIAAVSHLTLESRRPGEELGTRVEVRGGRIVDVGPLAMPAGTAVTVRHLFFNTPARRKFLRSAETERSHLVKAFLRLALANPSVGMSLEVDGRELHNLPATSDPPLRLRSILGREASAGLTPVSAGGAELGIEGFAGRPGGGTFQYFFVNRRPVDDRLLQAAVREGLGGGRGGPLGADYVLWLTINPREVDVNVHPTKREVRFSRPQRVLAFISAALSPASAAPSPPILPGRSAPPPYGDAVALSPPLLAASPPPAAFQGGALPPAETAAAGGMTLLGHVLGGYWAASAEGGLTVIDQHAAHERVLFERVLDRMRLGRAVSQNLLWPEEVEVPSHEYGRFLGILPRLEEAGCRLEPFGDGVFRIAAVPPEIAAAEVKAFVRRLLELFADLDETSFAEPGWLESSAALVACHGAVKVGEEITPRKMASILEELLRCRDPHHCPHGRPTMTTFGVEEMEKLFRRR